MHVCRYGWFKKGRVTRYVPGREKADINSNEPSAPAQLISAQGICLIEALIDDEKWFGRLMPKKPGGKEGLVILFKSPNGQRNSTE